MNLIIYLLDFGIKEKIQINIINLDADGPRTLILKMRSGLIQLRKLRKPDMNHVVLVNHRLN